MTIDVASLVFEIDSTQAVTARERLEGLDQAAAKVDASARKVKTATEMAGIGMDKVAAASGRAVVAATEHVKQQGAAERATRQAEAAALRAAEREDAAWAKVHAQLAKRNSAYQGTQALAALREEAAAASNLERRIDALMNSVDPARAAQARLNAEMAEATALYKAGAISASDYAKATSVLDQRMDQAARGHAALNGVMVKGAASAKVAQQAGLNLSRQFADIAVTGAMGMNPLMILIQQGPQVADAFMMAKTQGMGFSAVLSSLATQIAPVVALLTPLALVAGTAAVGFGLLHRELAKGYPDDITDGLGLTAEQLDRVKDRTVTMGDTWKATIDVMGKYLTQGPIGDGLDWLDKRWNAWLDDVTKNTVTEVATIVGVFIGGYRAIAGQWQNLPAIFQDLTAKAFNFVIDGVEKLVNANIAGINAIIKAATEWTGAAAPQIGNADLSGFKMQDSGAGQYAVKAITAEVVQAISDARAGMSKLYEEAGAGARKYATDRALEQAGKANKTPKGAAAPRDMSDERAAQFDAMLAQALAEELQARLAVTREVEARAKLEKEILDQQARVKDAQVARQRANIVDDKGLSDAKRKELLAQLDLVDAANARAAGLRRRAIEEEKQEALAQEALALRTAESDAQVRLLSSTRNLERSAAGRRAIDLDILKLQQELERGQLEQVVASTTATETQKKIAQALLGQLNAIHGNETSAAYRMEDAYDDAAKAANDVANAFERQDWYGLANGLADAMKALKLAFSDLGTTATKIGAAAGIANIAGQFIGGKAGGALSGAAGGAMAGFQLGGPWGAAIGGVLGGVASLFGGNKEKQRQKAQQEAADIANAQAIAQERANQQAELELRMLQLSGDEVAATALQRENELKALTGVNRALQEHVYELEDWAKAVSEAKDAVSKAEDDLRDAYNAERDRLQGIIGGVDAARDVLRDAYQRERAAIEGTATSLRSLIDTLSDFRAELDMASSSPGLQYRTAWQQFASAAPEDIATTGRSFVDVSRSTSATDLDFQRDLAAVRRKTDEASATAKTQLTNAERQLVALESLVSPLLAVNDNLLSVEEAVSRLATAEQAAAMASAEMARLDAQVGALITINSSVLSVAQAVANLEGAIGALARAEASKPTGGASGASYEAVGFSGYVDRNADLAALYASGSGMAAGRTKEEFGAYHWERYGQGEDRFYRPFARGGDHMGGLRLVGEEGPELEATGPSRIFSARQTQQLLGGDYSRLEALVERLTEKVEALTNQQGNDNREIKKNTKEVADIMAKVTQGKTSVRTTEVAA